jgi:GNAT superfamily N-acetyltransferase
MELFMQITIEAISAKDRKDWERLWRDYLAFYETSLPDEVFDTTWQRLLSDGEDPEGWLAINSEGEVLGLVHCLYHRSTWTIAPVCYLQDLYVVPTARGHGVGRLLIEKVYDRAEKAGASQVYWMTQDFNETARRLYDTIGVLTPFIKYRKP